MGVQHTADEQGEEWQEFSDEVSLKWILDVDEGPNAHLVRIKPGTVLEPHYHTENQWQIILEGSCTIEGEEVEPIGVHFTEARTTYGPIVAGEDGLTFMTLREKPAGYHPVDQEEEAIESVRSGAKSETD